MKVDLDDLAGTGGGEKSRRLAKYWLEKIDQVDAEQRKWIKRGIAIEKRYRDQRNLSEEEGQRRANYLWANTQILYPAIYGRCPVPVAERRFKDRDPVGRAAATIIERALRNDLDFDSYHESVASAVLDYLLPGRGVCWVRYEPEIGESVSLPVDTESDRRDEQGEIEESSDRDDEDEEEKLEDTGSRLIHESVPVDYVAWRDFYMFPRKARRWSEVNAVGKLVFMSRDEMVKRWGKEIGEAIPLQKEDKDKRESTEGKATTDKLDDKGHVYEIWDRENLEVIWVADGYDHVVDRKDDPLELDGFFPTPRPLSANSTNGTVVPVPFYIQYQDQARQIDELTQRTSQLAKACKVAGTYNAASAEIARLLDESVENELIPVDNWRTFADGKGLEGQISLLPIEVIVETLKTLQEVKQGQIEEMDRITGMTDVLRGVTEDARETLGKGRLNNNNGKSRLRQSQDEVARFCRDIIRIKAEIMCKHFSNRSLIDSSGALYEEGLGIADVLHYGEGEDGGTTPSAAPAPPPPGVAPSAPGGPPAPSHPPGAPGGNVVPFPAGPAGGGMPPGTPGMPPGAPAAGMPLPGAPPPPQMSPYGPLSDEMKVFKAVQKVQQALKLLRDDYKRGFRIDIEVDSTTTVADEEADKAARIEFVEAVTKYIGEAGQLAMANPQAVPLLGKLLQFAVRGFKVGRDLEQSIEEFCDQAEEKAKMAAMHPPPNPEMMKVQGQLQIADKKAQTDLAAKKMDMQRDMMAGQIEQQTEKTRAQAEAQSDAADVRMKQLQMQIEQMHASIEAMKARYEMQQSQQDHQHKIAEGHMQHQMNVHQMMNPQPVASNG